MCIYISLFRWVEYLVDRFKLLARARYYAQPRRRISHVAIDTNDSWREACLRSAIWDMRANIFQERWEAIKKVPASILDSPKKCKTMLVFNKMIDDHSAFRGWQWNVRIEQRARHRVESWSFTDNDYILECTRVFVRVIIDDVSFVVVSLILIDK